MAQFSRATPLQLCHSDPFRTPLQRRRKSVRITPGTLSELNRNSVRFALDCCPNKIGITVRFAPEYALDHEMAATGREMVRYADDFVVLCGSEDEARKALEDIQKWVAGVGLVLHPTKTRIVDAEQKGGFDFLGYHFERGRKWPRKKSEDKLKEAIRQKTRRNNGTSMKEIITGVNRTLKGWFEYFKHSAKPGFTALDKWVRTRLRAILRTRNHLKRRGRMRDHRLWPNAYFVENGLFSLATARAQAIQSPLRSH